MKSPLRWYGLEQGEVWRRALACALAMDALSPLLESDQRNPYTVGLLHGIGMIFVDRQLIANKSAIPSELPEEKEVRLMGVNHAEVGAYVLRQWNFPEMITEPVRCQFDPLYCLNHGKMACLLYVAKCMMSAILKPPPEGEKAPEPDPLVMTMINLDADEYYDIIEEAEGKFTLLEIAMIDL
jgi:HD-like signal output (HDOD) protein